MATTSQPIGTFPAADADYFELAPLSGFLMGPAPTPPVGGDADEMRIIVGVIHGASVNLANPNVGGFGS